MARSIWSGTISFGHIGNFPHQSLRRLRRAGKADAALLAQHLNASLCVFGVS